MVNVGHCRGRRLRNSRGRALRHVRGSTRHAVSLWWLAIGTRCAVWTRHLLWEAMRATRARGDLMAWVVDGLLESICLAVVAVVRIETLGRHAVHGLL
jgi:hypothetical protein